MPRPPRCRRICGKPQIDTFCPNGGGSGTPILLTLDEYEVIRLVDLEQRTHEQCAAQMDISRSTVQEIYAAEDRGVSCPRKAAAHHRRELPHLRRGGASALRPQLPDADIQRIRSQTKRRT